MARVALLGDNSTEYVSIILDIWNNKDCVVLFDCNLPLHVAINMMLEANIQKCFIEKSLFSKYVVEEFYNIEFIVYEKKKNTPSYLSERVYRQFQEKYTQDEAVVFYSSGTTGESKGIILSHFAINKNAEAIIDYMNLNKSDCIYIAKSLSHSSTFTGELLVALKTKTKVVIAPTIVPPRYVLANIFNFKVTIICLNPTLLAMYIEEYLRNNYDLSSLRTIYVSGSILSDNTYNDACKIFNDINICNVYGLSEAGPRVSAQRENNKNGNSVGKAINGVEIAIIDENGKVKDNGKKGLIHIITPSLFIGYISGKKKHESKYKGWFNTGDIGYFDKKNELHIVDRADDVIIINSHKIYPHEIQEKIIVNSKIKECVVLKVRNGKKEFIACIYVGQCEKRIKEKLLKALLPYEIPRVFIKCDSLPRNNNGKISKLQVCKLITENNNMKVEI